MMLYATYCARKYNMGPDQRFRWSVLGRTFIAALPALLTPALIVGGMTFGCSRRRKPRSPPAPGR